MAVLDSQVEFSDAQAVTGTTISSNVLDTASTQRAGSVSVGPNPLIDHGLGDVPVWLVVSVNTTFVGGTSLTVTMETADNAGLSVNSQVLIGSATFPLASLTAGTQLLAVPIPSKSYRRYVGPRYTVVGTMTAGALDAYLASSLNSTRAIYKSGFRVQ